jgi:hypothetical protein
VCPTGAPFLFFAKGFLAVVRQPKKQLAISDFWDLNPGPKFRLQSSRHCNTSPTTTKKTQ